MAEATSSGLGADTSSYGGYAATNQLLAKATNNSDNLNGWLTAARQGQALSAAQLDNAQKHLGALNDVVSSVMADPTPENANARVMDAIRHGVIAPDDGAHELQQIASFGNDPNAIRQYAFQHGQNIATLQQRMQSAYGDPSTIDNGQTINPVTVRTGPQAGVYAAGGNPLQRYMSPGEASAPKDYTLPNGQNVQTTIRGYGQAVGDTAGLPPAQGASAPMAAPSPGRVYTGARTAEGQPVLTDAQGYALNPDGTRTSVLPGAPPAAAAGTVVRPGAVGIAHGRGTSGPTIAGPGAAAPAQQPSAMQPAVPGLAGPSPMLSGGLEDYRNDLNNSAAKLQGVQPLLNALPLVRQLGQTGSGPGTKAWNDAKSALVSAGIIPAGATDVDVRDEANKYLKQYVSKSGIAQRSDMGTLTAEQSSPNLETSNKATDALVQNSIAQDRMEAARPLAYNSNDLSGYTQHKAAWSQSQDPRAYKLDAMPDDQRMALLKDMASKRNTAEGQRFFSSLKLAMKVGVRPPSAPAPAPAMGATGGQ